MTKKVKFKYVWDESMIDLGLKGNDLLIYAVVQSHSQNKQGVYFGSVAYLSMVTGASPRAVKDTINRLIERGFIDKKSVNMNGAIIQNTLSATGADSAPATGADSAPATGADSAPATYIGIQSIKIKKEYTEVYSKESPEKFRKILVDEYGCLADEVDAWFRTRKNLEPKKEIMSATAFRYFIEQVQKSGLTVAAVVHEVAGNQWYGFKPEYLERSNRASAAKGPKSVAAENMRAAAQLGLLNQPAADPGFKF